MNRYLRMAFNEAKKNIDLQEGGPFGAVIVRDGKVIARAHNQVLAKNDPTLHAEVNAIRKACKKLNTYDLSDCVLYTSCEPCPMCLSAIMWAKIKTVYYASTQEVASSIGFDDKPMYDYIKGDKEAMNIELKHIESKECDELFEEYHHKQLGMY